MRFSIDRFPMRFRAFIAVDIDPLPPLLDFNRELMDVGRGLKPVEMESVHITLKFLGDIDDALVPRIVECMRSSATGISPFEIRVQGSGVFPSRSNAKVVWAGLEGAEPLRLMTQRLESCLEPLGFPNEDREFKAHLTMARVKDPRASADAARVADLYKEIEFGTQPVRELRLKKSVLSPRGPTYSDVATVLLGL